VVVGGGGGGVLWGGVVGGGGGVEKVHWLAIRSKPNLFVIPCDHVWADRKPAFGEQILTRNFSSERPDTARLRSPRAFPAWKPSPHSGRHRALVYTSGTIASDRSLAITARLKFPSRSETSLGLRAISLAGALFSAPSLPNEKKENCKLHPGRASTIENRGPCRDAAAKFPRPGRLIYRPFHPIGIGETLRVRGLGRNKNNNPLPIWQPNVLFVCLP